MTNEQMLAQAKLNAAREANAGGTALCVVNLAGMYEQHPCYVVRHYADYKDTPHRDVVWIAYPSTINSD